MPRKRALEDDLPEVYREDLGDDAEVALYYRWRDHHDIAAAQVLVGHHRHLVTEIAKRYDTSGVAWEDLTGEAHLGLMRAVCRFDPDQGVPFTTYAAACIRASIRQFVQRAA